MVHESSVVERERLLRRKDLCISELKRARDACAFWSHELNLIVDALCDSPQLQFKLEE